MAYSHELTQYISALGNFIQNAAKTSFQELSVDIDSFQELGLEGEGMKIAGVALSEGAFKGGPFYSARELEKAAAKLKGIGMYFDFSTNGRAHNMRNDNLCGHIIDAYYDPEIKAIRFIGLITKQYVIKLILEKGIRRVSVGVGAVSKITEPGKQEAADLWFREISLVHQGADNNAKFEVV